MSVSQLRRKILINSMILAAAQSTVPATPSWSLSIGLVMIICNILGIAIARYATQERGSQPSLGPIGIPQLIAGTCFGHILGAGVILGLTNVGSL
ncbi:MULTISPECIES: photosystem I reaction center subunit PsaK [Aerosakkonema]|uniref:photosystem I reaction center subunit PsaK n=1 Tax=Aerosakkonema TaxID=1246629 RepID=UPI0035B9CCB5